MEACITAVTERQNVDHLKVLVHHSGGLHRPLYISQLWEPSSDSEGSVEIEVQVAPEAEILLSQSATPVWLGPRPKLLKATPKAHPKFL